MTLTPGSEAHWRAWLVRYGDDYATDEAKREAYQEALKTLTALSAAAADRFDREGREQEP